MANTASPAPKNAHERSEQRSRSYHQAIAERLTSHPEILHRAQTRVLHWLEANTVHPTYAAAWQEILTRSPEDIQIFLASDTEHARALQQVSPFAGALPPRERWRIWKQTKQQPDHESPAA